MTMSPKERARHAIKSDRIKSREEFATLADYMECDLTLAEERAGELRGSGSLNIADWLGGYIAALKAYIPRVREVEAKK